MEWMELAGCLVFRLPTSDLPPTPVQCTTEVKAVFQCWGTGWFSLHSQGQIRAKDGKVEEDPEEAGRKLGFFSEDTMFRRLGHTWVLSRGPIGLEAITLRLEAIAIRVEAIALRLKAIAIRVEAIAI